MVDRRLRRTQDSMTNEVDYVDIGLTCADICNALGRGMNGKRLDDLSQSVCDAIAQLTTWVELLWCTDWNGSLMKFTIAGPWRRSKRELSNRADGTLSPGCFMQRMIRK